MKSRPMWRVLCVVSFLVVASLSAKNALAEKIVAKDGDWTVFIDGRQGAFVSAVKGDGFPQATKNVYGARIRPVQALLLVKSPRKGGGESEAASEQGLIPGTAANPQYTQGTIERMRVRTGMISDTLGFGVRGPVTESTTVKSYMQIWAWVESAIPGAVGRALPPSASGRNASMRNSVISKPDARFRRHGQIAPAAQRDLVIQLHVLRAISRGQPRELRGVEFLVLRSRIGHDLHDREALQESGQLDQRAIVVRRIAVEFARRAPAVLAHPRAPGRRRCG